MNLFSKIFPLLLLMIFGPIYSINGQNETAEVDSTFEEYMRTAWDDISESEMSDSLQNSYSGEFYEYYLKHPDSETGKKALSQAVMMWGNTGNDEYIHEVLQNLDDDSEVWSRIITFVGNIYYRSTNLEREDYHELLLDLTNRLEDPTGKSEALLSLLRMSRGNEDINGNAVDYARQLVELDATEFHVKQGLGYLHELESLNTGQKAPDFEARAIDGEEISLSGLQGQFVLLEFWATWCGPCLPEIPHLKTLWNKFNDSNFKIVGISLDRDREALKEFIEDKEMEWPQIFETEGWEGEITRLYNVSGIPRMYVVGPEGNILAKDLRGEEMLSEIERFINEYSD